MMLASTVQFSRYGRYPPSTASWRGRFGPIEVISHAAVPSGPNSVLGLRNPWDLAFHAQRPRTRGPRTRRPY